MSDKIEKFCYDCANFIRPELSSKGALGNCKLGKRKKYPLLWGGTDACIKIEELKNVG